MTTKTRLTAALLLLLPLTALADLTGSIGLDNNYVWRGLELADTATGSGSINGDVGFLNFNAQAYSLDEGVRGIVYAGTSFLGDQLKIGASAYLEPSHSPRRYEINGSAELWMFTLYADIGKESQEQGIYASGAVPPIHIGESYEHYAVSANVGPVALTVGDWHGDAVDGKYYQAGFSKTLDSGLNMHATYTLRSDDLEQDDSGVFTVGAAYGFGL